MFRSPASPSTGTPSPARMAGIFRRPGQPHPSTAGPPALRPGPGPSPRQAAGRRCCRYAAPPFPPRPHSRWRRRRRRPATGTRGGPRPAACAPPAWRPCGRRLHLAARPGAVLPGDVGGRRQQRGDQCRGRRRGRDRPAARGRRVPAPPRGRGRVRDQLLSSQPWPSTVPSALDAEAKPRVEQFAGRADRRAAASPGAMPVSVR